MAEDSRAGILAGLCVLDLADEKGLACTKFFADLGADVVKIELPGGDPTRARPPFAGDVPDARAQPLLPALQREQARHYPGPGNAGWPGAVPRPGPHGRRGDRDVPPGHARRLGARLRGAQRAQPAPGPDLDHGVRPDRALPRLPRRRARGVRRRRPDGAERRARAARPAWRPATSPAGWPRCTPRWPPRWRCSTACAAAAASRWTCRSPTPPPISAATSSPSTPTTSRSRCAPGTTSAPSSCTTSIPARTATPACSCCPKAHWLALLEWIGNPPELCDPVFEDQHMRRENSDLINPYVEELCQRYPKLALYLEGQSRHLAVSPMNTPAEFVESEQTQARDFFLEAEHPVVGPYQQVGPLHRYGDFHGSRDRRGAARRPAQRRDLPRRARSLRGGPGRAEGSGGDLADG